jgi:hypothetical protein
MKVRVEIELDTDKQKDKDELHDLVELLVSISNEENDDEE